jgi:ABC-type transport system involved in cytochrome c biogenesis permease subunit
MREWLSRNPFVALAIALLALGWIAAWEADRIVAARHTVGHDWASGFLGGLAASIVLAVLLTAAAITRRRRRGKRFGWAALLTLFYGLSVCIAILVTAPPRTSQPGSYVVTTGIAVGGMTYADVGFIAGALLTVWAGVRMFRRLTPRPLRAARC